MHPALSYPALKSVLEYVELEKRIHLTSRSKFLQRIDKTTPVYAKSFSIWGDLSLDGFQFNVKHQSWDKNMEDEKNGELLRSYLKQRSSVNINLACFSKVKTSEDIPVKLDLTVNKLQTICCNLDAVIPMIDPRSFPITELSMAVNEPTNVDLEIVRSAKRVIFSTSKEVIGLEKLPNKRMYLRCQPLTDVVRIIKYWIQHGKEVGTEFSTGYSTNSDLRNMMANLQEEFSRSRGYSEEINEHCFSGFSIPLSSTSKLLVYGIGKHLDQLILKVV
ncbi:hypothetical protein GCK72_008008 [Caenorhabditis remanei]|uniref:F-box domain-containing protein n=1 Tax=Caenorhabditis remanei TaxID=31234 RepID=A0A6A5HP08_CAERE|nr:hypothetical protein GCK72_008008 [Caenorhabditis remanei]KAF1768047.1 hypothetical protein GCK72_008008 [Caenorhabditis remanei]